MSFPNQKIVFKSVVIALIAFCYLLQNEFADGRKFSDGTETNYLKMAKHKGTVKTIENKLGEVIDCVDIYKQPAFDHPLLKNHTIEMWPSSIKREVRSDKSNVNNIQAWNENEEFCPEGTIPILRAPNPNYPKKVRPFIPRKSTNGPEAKGHEYAQASVSGKYHGTRATFNVWQPYTFDNEFSLAQTWVGAGDGDQTNTIEAGWIANHQGDKPTKFFIFWTNDNYKHGCYNLCPGFVQVSHIFIFGTELRPLSTYDGQQYQMTITIHLDNGSGHWWLTYQGEEIGYWPNTLFTSLSQSSDTIAWGGEIINEMKFSRHTTTQMGSGHFPQEGFKRASYISNIQVLDDQSIFRDAEHLEPYATRSECYNIDIRDWDKVGGVYFYFGGPGFSDKCSSIERE